MGANVDPKTLCPYCDDPLPDTPTEQLLTLLAALVRTSRPDPRPANPLGRRAPMRLFAPACQRHRFERDWLPLARARRWPTRIDFAGVRARVERRKAALRAVLADADARGARGESVFWREVREEVRVRGARAAVGAGGQFATFERAQPG